MKSEAEHNQFQLANIFKHPCYNEKYDKQLHNKTIIEATKINIRIHFVHWMESQHLTNSQDDPNPQTK